MILKVIFAVLDV